MADQFRRGDCDLRPRGRENDGSGYNHDEISPYDLAELGLAALVDEAAEPVVEFPVGGFGVPGERVDEQRPAAVQRQLPPGPNRDPSLAAESGDFGPWTFHDDSVVAQGRVAGAADFGNFPLEVVEADEQQFPPDDSLDSLWLQPIPEIDETGLQHPAEDGVSNEERAVQLALEFLRVEGLPAKGNLDLLVDVIQQRGWTSVQFQVRGLVRAGYEVCQVHRMFELTDAWQHFLDSDTLAPERWFGGKRLTWVEAAQLLDFMGYDACLEEIADFLAVEKDVWQGLRRSSGQLATFKNYLFGYRLSLRTQVEDGIWQANLEPGDTRSFDGTRNPLCHNGWWDEPLENHAWTLRQILDACHDLSGLADWLTPCDRDLF